MCRFDVLGRVVPPHIWTTGTTAHGTTATPRKAAFVGAMMRRGATKIHVGDPYGVDSFNFVQTDSDILEEERETDELDFFQELSNEGLESTVAGIVQYSKARGGHPAWGSDVCKFKNSYILLGKVGFGGFSVVHRCQRRTTGELYAVKIINVTDLNKKERAAVAKEISILNEIQHPNIVKLVEVFEDRDTGVWHVVMELVAGGDLYDRIMEKEAFSERDARDLIRLLLSTVQYMHNSNVVHRDLKPENIILESKDSDTVIKVADFGLAERADRLLVIDEAAGTPHYVAPEVLRGGQQNTKVDIWSVGVITYVLLGGYPPFHDRERANLYRKIIDGDFTFHSPYWDDVSPAAVDFIRQMLRTDSTERASASELLEHRWVNSLVEPDEWDVMRLGAPFSGPLAARYRAIRRVRVAVWVVIAAQTFGERRWRRRLSHSARLPTLVSRGKQVRDNTSVVNGFSANDGNVTDGGVRVSSGSLIPPVSRENLQNNAIQSGEAKVGGGGWEEGGGEGRESFSTPLRMAVSNEAGGLSPSSPCRPTNDSNTLVTLSTASSSASCTPKYASLTAEQRTTWNILLLRGWTALRCWVTRVRWRALKRIRRGGRPVQMWRGQRADRLDPHSVQRFRSGRTPPKRRFHVIDWRSNP